MKLIPLLAILFLFPLTSSSVSTDLLQLEKRIIEVYKNSVPAVVNVASIKVARNFFYGDAVEVPQGSGTGFVWDDKGHIITNFHVVQGGDNFIITFHKNKAEYKAKVVGTDPKNDIAVLRLESMPKNFKVIPIGESKELQVGQLALAIGNPFGFDHSISRGIISALGRKMDGVGGVKINDMIQTDAAINQGNSGGPLIDSMGRVIGMNTMIVSRSGSSAGLGFAVPINTVKRIVPQLIAHGKVIRPGLGVGVLEDHIRERYVGEKGVVVTYVDPNGTAGKAGLKGMTKDRYGRTYLGDIITKINGKEVNTRDDIFQILEKFKIGDTVKLEFLREKKKVKVTAILREI